MTTGSNKAIFSKIYAQFKEIDLKMCVCYNQICENLLHFYVGYSHEKNLCAKTIRDECILSLNVANTMSTGSSKTIFIIIYAIYKEIDLKMCVAYYQIRQISAFVCTVLT